MKLSGSIPFTNYRIAYRTTERGPLLWYSAWQAFTMLEPISQIEAWIVEQSKACIAEHGQVPITVFWANNASDMERTEREVQADTAMRTQQ